MPRSVTEDARGIVDPGAGLRRFTLDRVAPTAELARFVELFWLISWDLPEGEQFAQEIVTHPAVNLAFEWWSDAAPVAEVHGVITTRDVRKLHAQGRVVGVKFRPGGFRPFLGTTVRSITDRSVPAAEVFGLAVTEAGAALAAGAEPRRVSRALDLALTALVPEATQPSEEVTTWAERIVAEPGVTRVEHVAAEVGISVRHLERRFRDAVGVPPKWVIRRARLHEAAERVRSGEVVRWSDVAAELGFADQSHLIREFRRAYGITPEAYARRCAASTASVPAPAGQSVQSAKASIIARTSPRG